MYNRQVIEQQPDHIHNNPVVENGNWLKNQKSINIRVRSIVYSMKPVLILSHIIWSMYEEVGENTDERQNI